jgi:hypothetical protein
MDNQEMSKCRLRRGQFFFGVERRDQDPARDIAQATIRDATIETKGRVGRKKVGRLEAMGWMLRETEKKREVARRVTVPHYPFAGMKKRERDEMF